MCTRKRPTRDRSRGHSKNANIMRSTHHRNWIKALNRASSCAGVRTTPCRRRFLISARDSPLADPTTGHKSSSWNPCLANDSVQRW